MITPFTLIRPEDHLPKYMRTTGRNRLPMRTRTLTLSLFLKIKWSI